MLMPAPVCCLLAVLTAPAFAAAAPPPAPPAAPAVPVPAPRDPFAEVAGQVRLVREATDRLVAALEHPDRRHLGAALVRYVRAYDALADRIAGAHVQLGAIEVRLRLARRQLERLRPAGADAAGAPVASAEEAAASPRAEALARLQDAYRRFQQDPAGRPAALAEVRALVDHLDQLDRWQDALRRGALPLVAPALVDDLGRAVADLELRHELQQRVLARATEVVAGRLALLPGDLERAALLHRSHAGLPREALDRLRREGDALLEVVTAVHAARLEVALTGPAPGPSPAAPADALLDRARRLLGGAPASAR
jgi:hypothetical protein